LADQSFGRVSALDPGEAHHKDALAQQLTSAFQLDFSWGFAPCFELPRAGLGELLGEFTSGVDAQLAFQPLDGHHLAHRQPLIGKGAGVGHGFRRSGHAQRGWLLVLTADDLLNLSMPRICIEKSLSTISWDRLLRPFMALGSTMIRTKGGPRSGCWNTHQG